MESVKKIIKKNRINLINRKLHKQAIKEIKGKNLKKILKLNDNKKFYNIHKNRKCFILGNGPSLKKVDFELLQNEYVFTVNQAANNDDFIKLNTNYHFWADPIFFETPDEIDQRQKLLTMHKKIGDNNPNIEVFYAQEAVDFIKENQLENNLHINYFYPKLIMTQDYEKEIKFDDIIPGFYTVVQYAICMAIYMGFKKIYLLGCDTTTIITKINTALNEGNMQYSYDITASEKERLHKANTRYPMEVYFETELKVLQQYRMLHQYASQKNVELINCSSKTIVDSIPRSSLEDVLKK